MRKNTTKGFFLAIDGPNGVGKSTVIAELKKAIESYKTNTLFTKEPTDTELGTFIRKNQSIYNGSTLACLVAADRYDHIKNVIQPNLENGKLVISDRYIASSFVYQKLDGVSENFIRSLNQDILLPDLYVILSAPDNVISQRLSQRSELTRFENTNEIKEARLYADTVQILESLGITVLVIENDGATATESAMKIFNAIESKLQIPRE